MNQFIPFYCFFMLPSSLLFSTFRQAVGKVHFSSSTNTIIGIGCFTFLPDSFNIITIIHSASLNHGINHGTVCESCRFVRFGKERESISTSWSVNGGTIGGSVRNVLHWRIIIIVVVGGGRRRRNFFCLQCSFVKFCL